MATIGSIRISASADTSKFTSDLNRAAGVVTGFGTKIDGARAALRNLATGLGIAAFARSVVKSAVDTETAMANLGKATDLPDAGLGAMQKELQALSLELKGVPIADLFEIATAGAKLGVASDDLVAYTKGIARVSIALDDIPAKELTETIGKLNVVFGLGVQGAVQLGSAVDKVADSGVSSAKDIFNVTQRISGTAKVMGLTAQQSIGLAGALLDTGSQAELASSAISRLLQAASNPARAEAFGKAIGVTAEEFAALVKSDPGAAIEQFLRAIKGLDAGGQQSALASIGIKGTQAKGELQKLAQVVDNVAKYTGQANNEFETLSQIESSVARNSQTTKSALIQTSNYLETLKVNLGAALLPAINSGLGLLNDFVTGISASFAQAGRIISEWSGGASKALGVDLAGVVDDLGYAFRNLPDFLAIAAIKVSEFFINLGEYGRAGIANLASFANYIATNWRELIVDAVNFVGTVFRNLGTNLGNLFSSIMETLESPWKGFEFNWTPLLDGFKATAAELPKLIDPTLTSLQGQIDDKLAAIGDREAARGAGKAEGAGAINAKAPETLAEKVAGGVESNKLPGLALANSKEAYKAIAAFANGGKADSPAKKLDTTNAILGRIEGKLGGNGAAGSEPDWVYHHPNGFAV